LAAKPACILTRLLLFIQTKFNKDTPYITITSTKARGGLLHTTFFLDNYILALEGSQVLEPICSFP
jgi:hypothetical protein